MKIERQGVCPQATHVKNSHQDTGFGRVRSVLSNITSGVGLIVSSPTLAYRWLFASATLSSSHQFHQPHISFPQPLWALLARLLVLRNISISPLKVKPNAHTTFGPKSSWITEWIYLLTAYIWITVTKRLLIPLVF